LKPLSDYGEEVDNPEIDLMQHVDLSESPNLKGGRMRSVSIKRQRRKIVTKTEGPVGMIAPP